MIEKVLLGLMIIVFTSGVVFIGSLVIAAIEEEEKRGSRK